MKLCCDCRWFAKGSVSANCLNLKVNSTNNEFLVEGKPHDGTPCSVARLGGWFLGKDQCGTKGRYWEVID